MVFGQTWPKHVAVKISYCMQFYLLARHSFSHRTMKKVLSSVWYSVNTRYPHPESKTVCLEGVKNWACTCVSWGFCSGIAEDSFLLGYAESAGNWIPVFQGNIVSSYSGVECWRSNAFGIWLSTDRISRPRRTESWCMAVSSSASCGVVSCVCAHTLHWPTVAIFVGHALLQTVEHLV